MPEKEKPQAKQLDDMPEIIIRPLALEDLADIWDYIAEDSQARADAFIDSIDIKLNELADSPHAGRSRMELLPGFGRYMIFYLSISGGIEIVRVLHSARDIEHLFTLQE